MFLDGICVNIATTVRAILSQRRIDEVHVAVLMELVLFVTGKLGNSVAWLHFHVPDAAFFKLTFLQPEAHPAIDGCTNPFLSLGKERL